MFANNETHTIHRPFFPKPSGNGRIFRATNFWSDIVDEFRLKMVVGRRWRLMRAYDDCFSASDGISTLHELLQKQDLNKIITREQAVKLLGKFHEVGVIKDVRGSPYDKEVVRDGKRLFRFAPLSPSSNLISKRAPLGSRTNLLKGVNSQAKEGKEDFKHERTPKLEKSGGKENSISQNQAHFLSKLLRQAEKTEPSQVVNATKRQHRSEEQLMKQQRKVKDAKDRSAHYEQQGGSRTVKHASVAKSSSILSVQEVENTWKSFTLQRLQKVLGVDKLDDIIDSSLIRADYIIHNMTQTNKNGIVSNVPKKDHIPGWIMNAMRCLANWPENVQDTKMYEGYESDVLSVIKQYFIRLRGPLLTHDMYPVFIKSMAAVQIFSPRPTSLPSKPFGHHTSFSPSDNILANVTGMSQHSSTPQAHSAKKHCRSLTEEEKNSLDRGFLHNDDDSESSNNLSGSKADSFEGGSWRFARMGSARSTGTRFVTSFGVDDSEPLTVEVIDDPSYGRGFYLKEKRLSGNSTYSKGMSLESTKSCESVLTTTAKNSSTSSPTSDMSSTIDKSEPETNGVYSSTQRSYPGSGFFEVSVGNATNFNSCASTSSLNGYYNHAFDNTEAASSLPFCEKPASSTDKVSRYMSNSKSVNRLREQKKRRKKTLSHDSQNSKSTAVSVKSDPSTWVGQEYWNRQTYQLVLEDCDMNKSTCDQRAQSLGMSADILDIPLFDESEPYSTGHCTGRKSYSSLLSCPDNLNREDACLSTPAYVIHSQSDCRCISGLVGPRLTGKGALDSLRSEPHAPAPPRRSHSLRVGEFDLDNPQRSCTPDSDRATPPPGLELADLAISPSVKKTPNSCYSNSLGVQMPGKGLAESYRKAVSNGPLPIGAGKPEIKFVLRKPLLPEKAQTFFEHVHKTSPDGVKTPGDWKVQKDKVSVKLTDSYLKAVQNGSTPVENYKSKSTEKVKKKAEKKSVKNIKRAVSSPDLIADMESRSESDHRPRTLQALQILTLLIPPANRRRLHLLLRLMSKMVENPRLQIWSYGTTRDLVLEEFTHCILFPLDVSDYDQNIALPTVEYMVDNYTEIMEVPENLKQSIENHLADLRKVKDMQQPLYHAYNASTSLNHSSAGVSRETSAASTAVDWVGGTSYCNRVSLQEYQKQCHFGSRIALEQLLDNIVSDPNMEAREKKKKLKQFQKSHPDLYQMKIPSKEVELDILTKKTSCKTNTRGKPLTMLKNLKR